MKLSVQDSLLPGANLLEKADSAARMGFDAIELRTGDLLNAPDEVRRALARLPLPVSTLCTNPQQDPVVEERDVRDSRLAALRDLIHLAGDLGARGIVMVPIRRPHRLPDLSPLYTSSDLELALFYRLLEDLVPQAEEAGVALLVEPLNFYEAMLVPNLGKAIEICRHFNSPGLRLMADTFHMSIMEPEPLAGLRAASSYLAHVHLSDSNRQVPGSGHIDFGCLFATLAEMGYTGYGAIEAIPPADLETGTAGSLQFLRRAMPEAAA